MGRRAQAPLQIRSVKQGRHEAVAAVPAIQYLANNSRLRMRGGKSAGGSGRSGGQAYNTELWVAPTIKSPPQLAEMMEGLTSTAFERGFVMRVINILGPGQRLTALDTVKAERKTTSATEFETPKGYRKAADELSLMMDEDAGREAEALLFDEGGGGKGGLPVNHGLK